MKITEKDVAYVAQLANLELTPSEIARMQKDLSATLDYIDQLSEVDTQNVQPMAQVAQADAAGSDHGEQLRADELAGCLGREAALKNAPLAADGFFRVPKVIER